MALGVPPAPGDLAIGQQRGDVVALGAAHRPSGLGRRDRHSGEPEQLDEDLDACRARLAELDPERIASDRADAGELAVRAATALMTRTGSRSILLDQHPQRLAREALFASVYALRPASRDALLERLGAA